MEVQIINKKELKLFQQHENDFNRMFQTLPKFAPCILAHILTGGRPATLIIHQKMLTLMMNLRRKAGIEYDIGQRQLAMKTQKSHSWFHRVNQIANMYGLPNCYTVFEELPWSKDSWKTAGKKTLDEYQLHTWKLELSKLSSLNFLNPKSIQVGSPHPVYLTLGYSNHAVKQSISKVRFFSDTLMTGTKLY